MLKIDRVGDQIQMMNPWIIFLSLEVFVCLFVLLMVPFVY